MKKLGWVVLAALSYTSWAASIGCGGVTKQELDTVKAELLANDEKTKSSLKSELTGIDQKYVTVQQLQMKVEKQLAASRGRSRTPATSSRSRRRAAPRRPR